MNQINFLMNLISIPSLSGQEQAVANFLVEQMPMLGFKAHIDAVGNAVGVRESPNAQGKIEREIVLLGHIDTVAGHIPVRLADGLLYGRGSVDAKGSLAAFVMAGAEVTLPPGVRLVVIGAVEEESATSKGARYAATQYRPDYCIIGEPSGWDGITLGYKGRLLIDYEYCRATSHTAGPEGGVAEAAVTWWNCIRAEADHFNKGRHRLFDQLMVSLRHIRTQSDGLSDRVTATVALRLPAEFDTAVFTTRVQQFAGPAHVHCYAHEAAYQSHRRTPLAHAFNQAVRQAGATPRFKLKTGTSDMNVVGPIWNCPIVAYGPGDSQLDHTPEERLVIDDYLRAVEILKSVLYQR